MSKKQKRQQSSKRERAMAIANVPNEGWMRARLEQGNRNLTVPSGTRYKRPKAGARGRDW